MFSKFKCELADTHAHTTGALIKCTLLSGAIVFSSQRFVKAQMSVSGKEDTEQYEEETALVGYRCPARLQNPFVLSDNLLKSRGLEPGYRWGHYSVHHKH